MPDTRYGPDYVIYYILYIWKDDILVATRYVCDFRFQILDLKL